MPDEFDWTGENPDVVFQGQESIAIYKNPAGQIVIRQERSPLEDEDMFVVIDKRFLEEFIMALQVVAENPR